MKRYEFHSALPPEEVFARLEARAKRGRYYGGWQEPEEFFYHRKGKRFYLGYTGIVPARGFVPFCGTVCADGMGSVITGGFSLLREVWLPFGIAVGSFWIVGLCWGQPPLPFTVINVAWLLILLGFSSAVQIIFFRGRRKTVLKFLEDTLLHEQEKE